MLEALERGLGKFGIDFAVYINDKRVYEALKEYLITQEGFSSYQQNAFVREYKILCVNK